MRSRSHSITPVESTILAIIADYATVAEMKPFLERLLPDLHPKTRTIAKVMLKMRTKATPEQKEIAEAYLANRTQRIELSRFLYRPLVDERMARCNYPK